VAHNAHTRYPHDEIDLRQLAQILWASKILIIAVTLVTIGVAAAYAFLSKPIYEATVQTLPPTASGLVSYNIASQLTGDAIRGTVTDTAPGIEPLTPSGTYKVFLRYLNSSTIRQEFFEKYYLPAQEERETEGDKQQAWKRLDSELTITLPQKADEYEASLSLEGGNPQTIAQWANTYVDLAIQAARKDLLNGLTGEVEIRRQSIANQITALRQVAATIRKDRIKRLADALAIAEAIGLEAPPVGSPLIAIGSTSLNTENIDNGSLLYLRGTKALRSELQQLKARKTDDAYIPELPDLLKKQNLIQSINLNPKLLSVAAIDRRAVAPEDPVKPQKTLILLLGLVLGGMIGLLTASIRWMLKMQQ